MNKNVGNIQYYSALLPPPLDKPVEKFDIEAMASERVLCYKPLLDKINELIERQNAIIEVLQKLAMK